MERPSDLEQMYAAALAEQAALKRKVRALEEQYAALEARRAELERQAEQAATDLPHAKSPAGPSDPAGPG